MMFREYAAGLGLGSRSAICTMVWLACTFPVSAARPISIMLESSPSPRVAFGVERLTDALREAGFEPRLEQIGPAPAGASGILVGRLDAGTKRLDRPTVPAQEEGFLLTKRGANRLVVAGSDDTGTLYGCQELARIIRATGRLPSEISTQEAPAFKLRGPCIGMQRPAIARDGVLYDHLYTPEEFPFFYDKDQWLAYLDLLLENRMNTLYLWNGHPFTSLLELPRYPEARELDDVQLGRNIEMFTWLTTEADKRGIWVIQMFYNIHLSHALARARNVPFAHSQPSELTREYTGAEKGMSPITDVGGVQRLGVHHAQRPVRLQRPERIGDGRPVSGYDAGHAHGQRLLVRIRIRPHRQPRGVERR